MVYPLYLQRPCRAVLPAASQCKGTRYLLARDARYYLMRPCIHWAWNQSAQCASCRGVATPGVSTFPRIVSSAVIRHKGSQEHQEDRDVHARLSRITLENQAIKAQLSQLTELVRQLLPQPSQAPVQAGEAQAAGTTQQTAQPTPTSSQTAGLPSPTWAQPEIPEVAPGPPQLLSLSHAGQLPMQLPTSPPARATGQVADVSGAPRAAASQPWASPANVGFPTSPAPEGLTPAQVPVQTKGKIQRGEYVDLSELLACDFQYRYSSLDDSQALEVVDSKLSLAPKRKARHLSNLQLWLRAWHIYEDTLLSFYPHRYMELSHYRRHISNLDQHFHWAAILSYDAQFRHKCAIHNLSLSAFDQQLYVTILDATATKAAARRCFCCQ